MEGAAAMPIRLTHGCGDLGAESLSLLTVQATAERKDAASNARIRRGAETLSPSRLWEVLGRVARPTGKIGPATTLPVPPAGGAGRGVAGPILAITQCHRVSREL